MNRVFFLLSVLLASSAPTLLLADTTPLCNRQVLRPAMTSTRNEQINTVEGSSLYAVTPTELGTAERKVKTKDGYITYEVTPPTFKQISETIEIEKERIELASLPAEYMTESKRVKIKDATQRWNSACRPVAVDATIPPHCLITEPAEYQTVTRKIIKTPARTVKKIIPAKTQTITRQVIDQPAQLIRKEIPAEYTSVTLTHVAKAAGTRSTQIDNEYTHFSVEITNQPATLISVPAWCEDQLQRQDAIRLQQRLQALGHYQGTASGIYDSQTQQALIAFQQANHLSSGAITLESLRKLGLY